jgi:hypothetical protein
MSTMMGKLAATLLVTVALYAFGGAGIASAQETGPHRVRIAPAARAQVTPRATRPRARIRVTPGPRAPGTRCLYRTETLTYPPPYDCEFPGPGYVRQCESRLVPENRPSGPVIVPRMWCWWERG